MVLNLVKEGCRMTDILFDPQVHTQIKQGEQVCFYDAKTNPLNFPLWVIFATYLPADGVGIIVVMV
jgi:hypothetical protein